MAGERQLITTIDRTKSTSYIARECHEKLTDHDNPSYKHEMKLLESGQTDRLLQPSRTCAKGPPNYPYNIFLNKLQGFIKPCHKGCVICPKLLTTCFAESTTLKHRYPMDPPNPKQSFNCKIKNVVYLMHNKRM